MEQIKVKQIAQNIIITIGNETFTKKMEVKEEREALKSKVASYEKKPTKKLVEEIRKIMTAKGEAKKIEEKVKKKLEKKEVKKIIKDKKDIKTLDKIKLLEKEVKELKDKLSKYEVKEIPNAAKGRSGEY